MSLDHVAEVFTGLRPLSRLDRPLEMVRQFTPNWFAAIMGTGVLALVLPQLPGVGPARRPLGEWLWWFDVGLFALFSALYAARWVLFGHEARRIFGHSVVSMFIGTIPMGLATILNGALAFALPRFGVEVVGWVQAFWWLDVAMAVACGVGIPFLMFTRQQHSIDSMTAVWLLPVGTAA